MKRRKGKALILETVHGGSKVWIEGMRGGQTVRRWGSVLKRTPMQIVLADEFQTRFHRVSGLEVGGFHDRIVALATDEEISAFEIEKAARAEREKLLDQEARELRRLTEGYAISLERSGEKYVFKAVGSAAQVRAVFAVLKGARR